MPASPPTAPPPDINRQRHIRAFTYALVALGVGIVGRALLGFDSAQTYAYGIVTYVALMMLNYRTMLARIPTSAPDPPRDQRR
jgi:hypothetical protein